VLVKKTFSLKGNPVRDYMWVGKWIVEKEKSHWG